MYFNIRKTIKQNRIPTRLDKFHIIFNFETINILYRLIAKKIIFLYRQCALQKVKKEIGKQENNIKMRQICVGAIIAIPLR